MSNKNCCGSGNCGCNEGSSCGCGCGSKGCGCGSSCSCGSSGSCHDEACSSCHEDFSKELLHMADDAWMELLHEKIKDKIEQSKGRHLDELAEIVASSNQERWMTKMKAKGFCCSFKDKIKSFFHKCDDGSCSK